MDGVDRVVTVLMALSRKESGTLREIARVADLSEATTLRYLSSLSHHGFVERDGHRSYILGSRMFELAQRSLAGRHVRDVARPVMERLREAFDETVNLATRIGDDLVLIEAVESRQQIRLGASIGERDSWHASALGKSMLSTMTRDEVERILETAGCDISARSRSHLHGELRAAQTCGYAVDDGTKEPGLRCVGAAVFDDTGRARYALSVSGLTWRMPVEMLPAVGSAVRSAATEISSGIGYASQQKPAGIALSQASMQAAEVTT